MANILILDDEEGIRTSLKDVLEDENYRVFTAENGAKGISLAKEKDIDIALVDIWLPNINGIDVIRKLKEVNPAIETIVITGHGNVSNAISAMQAGAYDFLEKPLSIDKVLFSIKKAFEHKFLLNDINIIKQNFLNLYKIPHINDYKFVNEEIDNFLSKKNNILIIGEKGTGKKSLLFYLYSLAVENNIPSVLLSSSPDLYNYKEKYIFIADVEGLDYKYFDETTNKFNNRLIVATVNLPGKNEYELYKDKFTIITLPSVKSSVEIFEYFVNYFLAQVSLNLQLPLKKISKDAINEVFNLRWEYNILEIKNLIESIYIHDEDIDITVDKIIRCKG